MWKPSLWGSVSISSLPTDGGGEEVLTPGSMWDMVCEYVVPAEGVKLFDGGVGFEGVDWLAGSAGSAGRTAAGVDELPAGGAAVLVTLDILLIVLPSSIV